MAVPSSVLTSSLSQVIPAAPFLGPVIVVVVVVVVVLTVVSFTMVVVVANLRNGRLAPLISGCKTLPPALLLRYIVTEQIVSELLIEL